TEFARYPTAAERSGDLGDLLQRTTSSGAPSPVVLYDPLTKAPFPNNVIPANRISPVSSTLLQMIPTANLPPGSLANFNALFAKPEGDKSQKYDTRYDWYPNSNNQIFARA